MLYFFTSKHSPPKTVTSNMFFCVFSSLYPIDFYNLVHVKSKASRPLEYVESNVLKRYNLIFQPLKYSTEGPKYFRLVLGIG